MEDFELSRTRLATKSVSERVSDLNDPEVESFLVQYLAIVFYSEMEAKFAQLVGNVFEKLTNERISNFLSRNQASIIKRINKSDINAFVESFGEDTKKKFDEAILEHRAVR